MQCELWRAMTIVLLVLWCVMLGVESGMNERAMEWILNVSSSNLMTQLVKHQKKLAA